MPELKWEQISVRSLREDLPEILRTKIPGGWLVVMPTGITFVPDPEHRWDGSSLP
jgi:hypothetical protein